MALSMFAGVLLVAMSFCAVACDPEEDDDGSEGIDPPSEDHNENAEVNKHVLEAIEKFKTEAEHLEEQKGVYEDDLNYIIHAGTDEEVITVTLHSERVMQLSHFNKRITSTTLELTYKKLEIIGEYTMTKTGKKITGMFTMTSKKVVVTYEIRINPDTGRIKLKFKGLSLLEVHTNFKEHFKHILKVVLKNWNIHLTEPAFMLDLNAATEAFVREYFKEQIRARLNKLLKDEWQKTRQANL